MGRTACDGCGRPISITGGIANFWTFGDRDGTDGAALTLELEDGSSHLLCYPCIDALPEHPTAADVETLSTADHADSVDLGNSVESGDSPAE
ncbi:DUF7561 family protein [Natronosalvus vescus]|uniref:DUF7561 family protein n=1 Tax=Natronosalvus vescus TaxID=2953881 RepID=UPI002090216C|nr:hypothetical protein [Natronosalvus vescus]